MGYNGDAISESEWFYAEMEEQYNYDDECCRTCEHRIGEECVLHGQEIYDSDYCDDYSNDL